MKQLCWIALVLSLANAHSADIVKVWQLSTNQLGLTGTISASLRGVAPDGSCYLRASGSGLSKIYWVAGGRILWTAQESPIYQNPILLNSTNLVILERQTQSSTLSVRWLRLDGDFVGEKTMEMPSGEGISDEFNIRALADYLLPSQTIPHFLTFSASSNSVTCWRLDDPNIWPAPSVRLTSTSSSQLDADIINPSGLPLDVQTSTNLTSWSTFRRVASLPLTNSVSLPIETGIDQFLRAVASE